MSAQLVIAREYGYAGWQDLVAEVSTRLGNAAGLGGGAGSKPALLSWRGNGWNSDGGLLGIATGAFGDAGDPEKARWFARAASAELLIDAGAVVVPSVCEGILQSGARGLLQLFQRHGLLPRP